MQTVEKGDEGVGEVGRRLAAKIAFMAAHLCCLCAPEGTRGVRGLSPKAVCEDEKSVNDFSVCELRLRFFERGVQREEFQRCCGGTL